MHNKSRGWRSRSHEPMHTLAALRPGQEAMIAAIPDDRARAQAIRFGMGSGALVRCVTALPGGPIILSSGRQEVAVGRGLARLISVAEAAR